jgi:sugar transferase (PEP-CTERM/EpsH1 system associated)
MSDVIFLAHRLPFPPDKGDKIRSYHLLRHLATRYRVHLGCFIDDRNDEQYIAELDSICASTKICKLNPLVGRARSTRGFITSQALSVPYYFDADLARWVLRSVQALQISSIVAYSSPMAQYVTGPAFKSLRRIMDFVDVDSDKWAQYAARKSGPMKWVYARESLKLLDFERAVAREFDASMLVTGDEVDLFARLSPETANKVYAVPNGVATDYFDPALDLHNPYPQDVKAVVFTGMMDYWANIDAVTWFATEVLPAIRSDHESAEFWIVGGSPTSEVLNLQRFDGVVVTGRVEDVRPYLRYSACAVAPLRVARGIQNKVLEAMAMGCRVVCTTQAATGIGSPESPPPFTVCDAAPEFARNVSAILQDGMDGSVDDSVRSFAVENHGWGHALEQFARVHSGGVD